MKMEEKKAKIEAVIEKLLLEEGLHNALTDEEVNAMLKRAWKSQADHYVDYEVRRVMEREIGNCLKEFKPRLDEAFELRFKDATGWTINSEMRNAIRNLVEPHVRAAFNSEVQSQIKEMVSEKVKNIKINISLDFNT